MSIFTDKLSRLNKLGINGEETIYRLTYEDAMAVVIDNLTEEQFNQATDSQLEQMVYAVADNFENIQWHEWGTEGLNWYLSSEDPFKEKEYAIDSNE